VPHRLAAKLLTAGPSNHAVQSGTGVGGGVGAGVGVTKTGSWRTLTPKVPVNKLEKPGTSAALSAMLEDSEPDETSLDTESYTELLDIPPL
jgi:hypothetical protein